MQRKLFKVLTTTTSLICLLIGWQSYALARDYKVEVIVFERLQAGAATESHHYDAPKEMKHEAGHWLLEPSLLLDEAERLQESDEFLVQQHYVWGIESLPYEKSANFNVIEAQSRGYIKVYADHLLFTNIDLDYKGFRMREKRRLKLNEKHYFDHPKFGLLLQVSRLEEQEQEELADQDEQLDQDALESTR